MTHLRRPATPRNSNSNRSVRVEQVACGGEAPHHLLLALLLRTPVGLDVRGANQLSFTLCEAENLAKDKYHLCKKKLVAQAPSWWRALCTALQPSAAQVGGKASAQDLRRPGLRTFHQNDPEQKIGFRFRPEYRLLERLFGQGSALSSRTHRS